MTVFHLQWKIIGNEKPVVTAYEDIRMIALSPDPRLDGAVIESGDNIDLKGDLSLDALHDSQNLLMGTVFAAFAHGEKIKKTRFAVFLPEGGFKNQRVL